jgi:heat shock protein HslJ
MKKKWIIASLMILMLGMAACRTSRQTEKATSGGGGAVPLTGTYWKLTDLSGEPVRATSDGDAAPYLTFEAGKNSVFGNSGCNVFRGPYELGADSGIRFSSMILTRKMCLDADIMTVEDRLMHVFDRVKSRTLRGDTLILYGESAEALARFEAVPQ